MVVVDEKAERGTSGSEEGQCGVTERLERNAEVEEMPRVSPRQYLCSRSLGDSAALRSTAQLTEQTMLDVEDNEDGCKQVVDGVEGVVAGA